ncbi:MAG: BatA and WFA domain-containing protein [Anaerolineae bacterium]|nr:BatA and WFA domain-containing protein [Anaerolineae bacterium]
MLSSLSTLSLLSPLALALGALAIPIILLYMLRLRRTEMPISSTFLWQQLVRDREANAPWQRLRLSWLLLLQLLILALLVIALARPFTKVKTISTGRMVLLLDASASMKATDVEPSRFDAAREIGLDLVDTLGSDDTMTVIQVSAVPEVLAAASRDKLVLRRAIRSAEPSDVSADWQAAMTLAASGSVGVNELKVVIISDGGLPDNLPPIPGVVRFVSVGERASNVAISALATDAMPGSPPQLFARITNYGYADTEVIFDIRLNNSSTIYWAYRYKVPTESYVDIFEIELPEDFDTITAQLTQPSSAVVNDYLDADNTAYAVRDRSGAGRVLLVTEDNIFLRQIFRSLRGVQLFEIAPEDGMPRQAFDLYVFDGWLPDQLPDGDLLIVNPPPNTDNFDDIFRTGSEQEAAGDITLAENDSRVRNLISYANSISIRKYTILSDMPWADVLMTVDGYPLIAAGEIHNRQIALIPFDTHYPNTDMVLQPAWPILIAELSSWFSPPRITDTAQSLPPGAPVTIHFFDNADKADVILPDGKRVTVLPDDSEMVFADTFQPGLYRVELRRDDQVIKSEQFAVNLFDDAESRIAPLDRIVFGTTAISGDSRPETGRREWWPWLAGIGLIVLIAEWWVYHRRLQRIPRVTVSGLRSGRQIPESNRLRALIRRLARRRSQPGRTQ